MRFDHCCNCCCCLYFLKFLSDLWLEFWGLTFVVFLISFIAVLCYQRGGKSRNDFQKMTGISVLIHIESLRNLNLRPPPPDLSLFLTLKPLTLLDTSCCILSTRVYRNMFEFIGFIWVSKIHSLYCLSCPLSLFPEDMVGFLWVGELGVNHQLKV